MSAALFDQPARLCLTRRRMLASMQRLPPRARVRQVSRPFARAARSRLGVAVLLALAACGTATSLPPAPGVELFVLGVAQDGGLPHFGCDRPCCRAARATGRVLHPTALGIVVWFNRAFRQIGLQGCSSHSGRRTFVTRAARLVHKAGGSLRDVQLLAGHRSIETTQRYIDGDTDAQRKLVAMI